jgi:hypothetical protein
MPSTAIRTFSYDPQTRTLFVTFIDGDLYAYRGVEAETYQAMRAAISKGRFFARRLRGRYAYAKIEEGQAAAAFIPPDGTGLAAGR